MEGLHFGKGKPPEPGKGLTHQRPVKVIDQQLIGVTDVLDHLSNFSTCISLSISMDLAIVLFLGKSLTMANYQIQSQI